MILQQKKDQENYTSEPYRLQDHSRLKSQEKYTNYQGDTEMFLANKIKVLMHNLREIFNASPEYKIVCAYCGKIQSRSKGWDWQTCNICGKLIYDERV